MSIRSPRKTHINQRWVVKAGSQMVCTGGPLLLRAWAQQVVRLRKERGIEVVWVTSGAIASAAERVRGARARAGVSRTLTEKQALSAMGQPIVMDHYRLAFATENVDVAQILLTYDDLSQKTRRTNFIRTVNQLLSWSVVPILNENDAVSTEEIQFGDNDSLSAKVADAIGADRLVILTDVHGLYDVDPKMNKSAQLIHRVRRERSGGPRLEKLSVDTKGSWRSVGGMKSKLDAAKMAVRLGVETWLVKGDDPDVLISVADDKLVGTRFLSR